MVFNANFIHSWIKGFKENYLVHSSPPLKYFDILCFFLLSSNKFFCTLEEIIVKSSINLIEYIWNKKATETDEKYNNIKLYLFTFKNNCHFFHNIYFISTKKYKTLLEDDAEV